MATGSCSFFLETNRKICSSVSDFQKVQNKISHYAFFLWFKVSLVKREDRYRSKCNCYPNTDIHQL